MILTIEDYQGYPITKAENNMTKSQHIKKLQEYNANQAIYIDELKALLDRWVEIGRGLTEFMSDEQVAECAIMVEEYRKL